MLLDGKRAYPKMIDGFFLLFLASNNTYINPANEAREIHEARKPTSKMISVRICRDQQGMVWRSRAETNRGETTAASCPDTYISCLAFDCDRKVSISIGSELNHVWFRLGECGNLESSLDAMINCDQIHVR